MITKTNISARFRSTSEKCSRGARFVEIAYLESDYGQRIDQLRVDLAAKIRKIKSACRHDFQNIDITQYPFSESNVQNIYVIGGGESDRTRGFPITFSTSCLECGEVKRENLKEICPSCLGKMSEPDKDINRAKYFGQDYMYYAAMVVKCKKCNIGFVWDVWDK